VLFVRDGRRAVKVQNTYDLDQLRVKHHHCPLEISVSSQFEQNMQRSPKISRKSELTVMRASVFAIFAHHGGIGTKTVSLRRRVVVQRHTG
jgi:hypothetical protein